MENIPKYYFELSEAKNERTTKRLIVALLIVVILLFVSNMAWLHAWSSYDYTSNETTYAQDGEGTNIIGNMNEVDNGAEIDAEN